MFDFLMSATILDVADSKKTPVSTKKNRTPDGLTIRVFRDGSVWPSKELVSQFQLEYPNAVVTNEAIPLPEGSHPSAEPEYRTVMVVTEPGNGFDVFKSIDAAQFSAFGKMLIISPVNRKAGKVDLFASTGYNKETGEALSSVLDQGAKTFGADVLLPMIKEMYGLELTKEGEIDFIDLTFVANPATGQPWGLPEGKTVTTVPKLVSRGADKGLLTMVRRENPSFYVLYPTSLIEAQSATKAQTADDQQVEQTVEEAAVATEVADAAVPA